MDISGWNKLIAKSIDLIYPFRVYDVSLKFDFLLKDPVPDTPAVAGAIKSQLFMCSERIRFMLNFWCG